MTEPIRVFVADDQSLLRGSFRVLIDTAPGLTAVGEAGTGPKLSRVHSGSARTWC